MTVETWTKRIARARELAQSGGAAAPLLAFYGELLTLQARVHESLRSGLAGRATGSLEQDIVVVRAHVPQVLQAIAESGPPVLALEAGHLLEGKDSSAIDAMLLAYWRAPSDRQFFAKAILQPYAQWLAEAGVEPVDRPLTPAGDRCPLCGGAPQLSILHTTSDLEGGGRQLLCATCLTTWPFRRVVCPFCGEEDDRKLGYFHTPAFDHLRVDACDSCRHYVKTVDLTRLGLAVPIVDEVAGAPLDVWACDHGYQKLELNLLGL
jgi:FdhE protein